jgi:hypothetical protein
VKTLPKNLIARAVQAMEMQESSKQREKREVSFIIK